MPSGAGAFRLEHVTGFRSSAIRDLSDRRIDTVGMVRF
ncbi:Polygalacturonase OS=Sphingobium scionense OX=1404341 GN=GGQ90_004759 PE=4 SV=1 [Sphingobium scionense]